MEEELIRILLVEDTPGDVQLLGFHLRQVRNVKYRLTHVGLLADMQSVLRSGDFDVLVLDLNLPDSKGLSTVTEAMKAAPWIPIVVLTSIDNEVSGIEAMRRGAQDYLVKGEIDGWRLIRTIRYAMERKRALRETLGSLAMAGEAQRALLPSKSSPGWVRFAATARNRMCGSVGGDFFDFIPTDEAQVAVCIGDVMGHDTRAALLMAQILGLLRSQRGTRSLQIMSSLNNSLLALGEKIGAPVTCSMFHAILDAPSDTLFFVNAGHPAPYLYDPRTKRCNLLHSNGILLGVQGFDGKETCHVLGPKTRLVLYTDGVVDACNASGERFGSSRLEEAICKYSSQDLEGFADGIMAEVSEFRQETPLADDETIVVVDRV